MRSLLGKVLLFYFCSIWVVSALGQEELPFWREKKKVYRQITHERRVIVSVKQEEVAGKKSFRMVGVGAVNAPIDFCVGEVMEFDKLPEISSYFKKVVHQKDKKQVYIVLEAMGYQARLLLEYQWNKKDPNAQQMDWKVIWGPFKGMIGHYQFVKINGEQTEVSIWSNFSNHNIPIPEFLMKFTLEVIAEKVAQKMRSFIEDNYRKNKKKK